MMASVTKAIQALGVQVEIIPGGCTGLCQPVDVGVNKPLKGKIRHYWEQYMIEESIIEATTKPLEHVLIANWYSQAYTQVDTQTIINAWRKTGPYTWFVPTCAPRPIEWKDPFAISTEEDDEFHIY